MHLGLVLGALTLFAPAPAAPASAPAAPASTPELRADQVASLARLGKVWGFLKYHHPLITAGELDWDAELLRVIPKVLEAPDAAAANAVMTDWVLWVGVPEACDPCAGEPAGDLYLVPRLDWIGDEGLLGAELAGFLSQVHANRHARGSQHYLSQVPGVGNPSFDNEEAYPEQRLPDAGYRLLALFRFWNIIEYWFPYRDLIEEDWDGVLAEFVPRLHAAEDEASYALALMELIARVHDTHANLWSSLQHRPPTGLAQLPFLARFVEGRALLVEAAPPRSGVRALPAGAPPTPSTDVQVGDVLLAIDGIPVERLVADWQHAYAASNEPTRRRDLARSLTRGAAGPVRLRVERGGEELEVMGERVPIETLDVSGGYTHDLPGESFRLLSEDVAYLKFSAIEQGQAAGFVERAQGTKGWILDLRNYPTAFMVFELGGHLVEEPTPFARFTAGQPANPGAFAFTPPISLAPKAPHYAGRVVILVDEVTQSQAEYTSMAFRAAPDALVCGSTTAAADGNVSAIPLPGGLRGMISGIGVFYPDRTPTQRIGIVPDVVVRPTVEGLRAGRDELLEEGLRQILGPETPEADIQRLARF